MLLGDFHPEAEIELEQFASNAQTARDAGSVILQLDALETGGVPEGLVAVDRNGGVDLYPIYAGSLVAIVGIHGEQLLVLCVRRYASRLDESAALKDARARLTKGIS